MKTADTNFNEEFSYLEEKLTKTLIPIKPDPKFISKMQKRLLRTNEISIDRQKKNRILLILSLGIVFGTMIVFYFKKVG